MRVWEFGAQGLSLILLNPCSNFLGIATPAGGSMLAVGSVAGSKHTFCPTGLHGAFMGLLQRALRVYKQSLIRVALVIRVLNGVVFYEMFYRILPDFAWLCEVLKGRE